MSKAPTNTRTTSNTTSNSVTDSGKEKEVENEGEEGNEEALHALFCEMPEVRTLQLYHSIKILNKYYQLLNIIYSIDFIIY